MDTSLASLYFLAFIGVLLPIVAIRSSRKLNAGAPFPPRRRVLLSTLAVQVLNVTLALWAARTNAISLWRPPRFSAGLLLCCVAFFCVITLTLPLRWRRTPEWRRRRLALITPQHPRDYALWALLALAAGIGEEIVWRGVFFTLLLTLTKSATAAAVVSALHFGVCHMVQGVKSVLFVAIFALAAQGIVLAAGSLLPTMVIHFSYDVIAGIWFERLARDLPPVSATAHLGVVGAER